MVLQKWSLSELENAQQEFLSYPCFNFESGHGLELLNKGLER